MGLFSKRLPSLAAEMRLLMTYFAAFDGTQSWTDGIEPIANRTLHADLQVHEDGKVYNKEQFMEKLKNFVEQGGSMDVHKLKQRGDRLGIQYEVTFHKPEDGGTFTTKSLGVFQDGQLIRVQRDHVRQPNNIL